MQTCQNTDKHVLLLEYANDVQNAAPNMNDKPRSPSSSSLNTPEIPRVSSSRPFHFASCFSPGANDVWAPYTPLTAEKHPQEWHSPGVNEMYEQLKLPFNMYILNERDMVAIAYAFESRSLLVAETEVAKLRARRLQILSRSQELDVMNGEAKIQLVNENLDRAVVAALKHISASYPPDDAEDIEPQSQPSQPHGLQMSSKNSDFYFVT
jgi:hypothetical protein